MERIISAWKMTYDYTGSPLVLLNYGDLMDAEVKPKVEKPLEVIDLVDSEWPFLRVSGNRKFDLAFTKYDTWETGPLARRQTLDSMLLVGSLVKKYLAVEVEGFPGTYWSFGNACVTTHESYVSKERGKNRVVKSYNITATHLTRVGP